MEWNPYYIGAIHVHTFQFLTMIYCIVIGDQGTKGGADHHCVDQS